MNVRGKFLRLHISDHFVSTLLQAVFVEENNGWWSEDTESFQQRLVFFIIRRDIGLQQHCVR